MDTLKKDSATEEDGYGSQDKKKKLPTFFQWNGNGASMQTNKILLFLANLLLMLPFVIQHNTAPFPILAAASVLIQIVLVFPKSQREICATAYLPTFFFFDALLLIAAFALPYIQAGGNYSLGAGGINVHFTTIVVALAGVMLFLVKGWLGEIGLIVFATAATFGIFGEGTILAPELSMEAKTILLVTFFATALWSVFCQIARVKAVNKSKLNKWLGFLLVCSLIAIELLWREHVLARTWELGTWLDSFGSTTLSWWHTALLTTCVLLLAACAFNFKNFSFTADAEVYVVIGLGILLVKIVSENYFSFHWVVVLAYMVLCFAALSTSKERMMGLRFTSFYPLLFAVCVLATWMLRAGLVWNIIVTVLGLVWFYSAWRPKGKERSTAASVCLLLFITLEAVAFCISRRFSTAMLIMLFTELAGSIVALLAVDMRYKEEGGPNNRLNVPISALLLVLTALTVLPRGIRVTITPDGEASIPESVSVEAVARGKNDTVTSISYVWDDAVFTAPGEETAGESGDVSGFTAEVAGKHLLVKATSSNGLTKSVDYWVPTWKTAWLCTEPTVFEPEVITWREAYVRYFQEAGFEQDSEIPAAIVYIDGDEIPELWIQEDESYGLLLTYADETVSAQEFAISSFSYIPRSNRILCSQVMERYGEDDSLWGYSVQQTLLSIQNGTCVQEHFGEYQTDTEWSSYFEYYMDGEAVSNEDYDLFVDENYYDYGTSESITYSFSVSDVWNLIAQETN